MSARKLFQIDIGVDEDSGRYVAQISAVTENKGIAYDGPSLKAIFPRLKRALLQKNSEIRRFPLPVESLILSPNGNKLMITP